MQFIVLFITELFQVPYQVRCLDIFPG